MKYLPLAAAALLVSLCAFAQDSTPPLANQGGTAQTQQPNPMPPTAQPQGMQTGINNNRAKIAAGSIIPVQLTKTIDAKKVKTGDPVEAKVTQDMKSNAGDVLVAKDTKIVGHVTEAQARSKEQKESQVAIAFDHEVTKDGSSLNLPLSIQAIIAPPNQNNSQASAPGGEDVGARAMSHPSPGGSPGMQSSAPPPEPSATGAATTGNSGSSNPPITAQTKGVVGLSNLTLSEGANGAQGSVVTSEKNNVKLENGTLMLLKVNQ